MPYSFTQIEKDKSAVIGFVFFFLMVFYVFVVSGLAVLSQCFALSYAKGVIVLRPDVFDAIGWVVIFVVSVVAACLHYFLSIMNLTSRILRWVEAVELDPSKEQQKIFLNVLDEVSAATGGKKFHGVILPSSALNALAIDDEDSLPVIGITEGALCRLNRAQLEAVVAQEAAHILKGDCSTVTMVSAMFEFYTLPIRSLMAEKRESLDVDDGEEGSPLSSLFRAFFRIDIPIVWAFLAIVATFYFITSVIALLMHMFISREVKLRADAIAVRLTRDPVSLAQAIRLLSDNWRGAGSYWEALEGIFFVNPSSSVFDEGEGIFPDLFSTHPPVKQRLNVLLEMAHYSPQELEDSTNKQMTQVYKQEEDHIKDELRKWLLQKDGQWLGPFGLVEIGALAWFGPDTLIKIIGNDTVKLAREDEDLKSLALSVARTTSNHCPACKCPLEVINYEHQQLMSCPTCKGILVNEEQAGVAMARKEVSFGPDVLSLAQRMNAQSVDQNISWDKLTQGKQNGFICPHCFKQMQSRLFNQFYPVPVDKCLACGFMWFEAGELNLLQALYEAKNSQPNG